MVYGTRISIDEAALIAAGLDKFNQLHEVIEEITRREPAYSGSEDVIPEKLDLELGSLKKQYNIAKKINEDLTNFFLMSYPFEDKTLPEHHIFQAEHIFEYAPGQFDTFNSTSTRKSFARYFAAIGQPELALNLDPDCNLKLEDKITESQEEAYKLALATMAHLLAEKIGASVMYGNKVNKKKIAALVLTKCQELTGSSPEDACGISKLDQWFSQGEKPFKD